MIQLKRTSATNNDFIKLVAQLDEALRIVDGDMHDFYDQFNGISNFKYVIVAYKNGVAVGCGAIKAYEDNSMEIKRMFVPFEQRKQGIAKQILGVLETWTKELNKTRCILETGSLQVEAIGLYTKCGYQRIPNYGQYAEIENSVCFEKILD